MRDRDIHAVRRATDAVVALYSLMLQDGCATSAIVAESLMHPHQKIFNQVMEEQKTDLSDEASLEILMKNGVYHRSTEEVFGDAWAANEFIKTRRCEKLDKQTVAALGIMCDNVARYLAVSRGDYTPGEKE